MPDHCLWVPLTIVPIKNPGGLTTSPTPNLPAVPRVPERQDRTPGQCLGQAQTLRNSLSKADTPSQGGSGVRRDL